MVVLLVFIVATLEIFFGRKKKTVGRKIRSIWWKRPARYLGIETSLLSQRLSLRMVRKKIGHRLKTFCHFFFQVLMQCLQKAPENYYRSLSGKI